MRCGAVAWTRARKREGPEKRNDFFPLDKTWQCVANQFPLEIMYMVLIRTFFLHHIRFHIHDIHCFQMKPKGEKCHSESHCSR